MKRKKEGAKVITIDPIYTESAKKSDAFIQVKPGSDGSLAVAIAKYIVDHEWVDLEFIEKYTVGWDELKEQIGRLLDGRCITRMWAKYGSDSILGRETESASSGYDLDWFWDAEKSKRRAKYPSHQCPSCHDWQYWKKRERCSIRQADNGEIFWSNFELFSRS